MESEDYRHGVRAGVGAVVRGLLAVDVEELDTGALVGSLTKYEALLESWLETELGSPVPNWEPTAHELGIELD